MPRIFLGEPAKASFEVSFIGAIQIAAAFRYAEEPVLSVTWVTSCVGTYRKFGLAQSDEGLNWR
jgi:hypothetical protein